MARATAFISAAKDSQAFHQHWAKAPTTRVDYRRYVDRMRQATHIGHLVIVEDEGLAGVININEVVRGSDWAFDARAIRPGT